MSMKMVINHLNRRAIGEGEMPDSQASDVVVDLALWQLNEELRRRQSKANGSSSQLLFV
jgi:hypothetical protein